MLMYHVDMKAKNFLIYQSQLIPIKNTCISVPFVKLQHFIDLRMVLADGPAMFTLACYLILKNDIFSLSQGIIKSHS